MFYICCVCVKFTKVLYYQFKNVTPLFSINSYSVLINREFRWFCCKTVNIIHIKSPEGAWIRVCIVKYLLSIQKLINKQNTKYVFLVFFFCVLPCFFLCSYITFYMTWTHQYPRIVWYIDTFHYWAHTSENERT